MSQLLADCLSEIFEYLEDDKFTLNSCILVNRLWCEISVKIFWRNVWNYSISNFSILIACLPNESKENLYKNGIIISIPTSKSPTFNYASFCKVLSISRVHYMIKKLLNNQQSISPQILKNHNSIHIVIQEICKMFMNQISSLKRLEFSPYQNLTFTFYPGSKDCLKNLSELRCNSSVSSEFFHHLSQICHNIHTIEFEGNNSNGLTDLISVQQNLKCFGIVLDYKLADFNLTNIIPIISKLPNTLIRLDLHGGNHNFSLLFITNFKSLQELQLSSNSYKNFKDFEKLQYAVFPQLQILKIRYAYPRVELLIKFLEINGKNLKELYLSDMMGISDDSLNLAIAKFCTNLRKLSTGFKNDEMETLKMVFNDCQYLESINIWCGGEFLSEKEALEMFAKYSHKNISKLILCHISGVRFELLPEELEPLFISWTNRIPQKSFSLVIAKYNGNKNSLDINEENMEIIKKYTKLGVIRKFKVTDFNDNELI